ncbi:MAG: hypothetical protein BWY15_02097 [Firmicutes bacterium ADurb.Bin193]|nr:MAG: hypothetical protein BWY15_02097 [Firmicutes bacterium ADurb.Bin193]
MKEIIDYINQEIENCIDDVNLYGLCHLLEDDSEEVYPSIIGSEGNRVTPDDRHNVTIYHRLLDGDTAPKDETPFGRKSVKKTTQRVRTVIFIKMTVDETEDLINDIINALPESFTLIDYPLAYVSNEISLIRDRSAIWDDEYGTAYKDKYQKRFNVYALEYDCQYIKCPVCA